MATKKSLRRVGAVAHLRAPRSGRVRRRVLERQLESVPPVYTLDSGTGDTGTSSQTDSSTGADSSQPSDDGSPSADSNADTNPVATQQDGAPIPPEDAATCTTDAGCWSCTPTSTARVLEPVHLFAVLAIRQRVEAAGLRRRLCRRSP